MVKSSNKDGSDVLVVRKTNKEIYTGGSSKKHWKKI